MASRYIPDAQHHYPLRKCKWKPGWGPTSHHEDGSDKKDCNHNHRWECTEVKTLISQEGGNSLVALKVQPPSTMWLIKSAPRYVPRRNKSISPYKTLHMDVVSSIIHNTNRWRQLKCPLSNEWVNFLEWNVTRQWKGTKHWHVLQCGCTLRTWCYRKEATHTQNHTCAWLHIYEVSKTGKSIETTSTLVVESGWGVEWGGRWVVTVNEQEGFFEGWTNLIKLGCYDGCIILRICQKTHIDLYILNKCILCYVNSISAKDNKKQQHLHSTARTQWLLAGHMSQGGNDVEDQVLPAHAGGQTSVELAWGSVPRPRIGFWNVGN